MLRMPTTYVSPPTVIPVFYQQDATPAAQYDQADHAASSNLIWHGDQASAVRYFKDVDSNPVKETPLPPEPFLGSFGLLRKFAFAALASCFLFIGGCKKLEVTSVGSKPDATVPTKPRFLIGRGRTEWHARKAIRAHGESLIGHKNRFSHCFREKIHIKYVGKPTCRRIKRRLYECQRLWKEIYCNYTVGRQINRQHISNDNF